MRSRHLTAALLLAAATPAVAGVAIPDADLATFARLQDAKAMGEARAMFLGGGPRPKGNAELERALQESGWTKERYSTTAGEVEEIVGILSNIESDKENEAAYKQQLAEEHDAATVSRVKARRDALDWDAARRRAEQRMRDERKLAATGRPVTAAELQGTWVFDLEASLAHVQGTVGLPAEAMGKMRAALEKNQGTTYAFAGSVVEVRGTPAGNSKGSFRIDGSDLVIADGKREHRLQVGLKGSDLVISMMGVGTVYRRR